MTGSPARNPSVGVRSLNHLKTPLCPHSFQQLPRLAPVGSFIEAALIAGAGGHDDGCLRVPGLNAAEVERSAVGGRVGNCGTFCPMRSGVDGARAVIVVLLAQAMVPSAESMPRRPAAEPASLDTQPVAALAATETATVPAIELLRRQCSRAGTEEKCWRAWLQV